MFTEGSVISLISLLCKRGAFTFICSFLRKAFYGKSRVLWVCVRRVHTFLLQFEQEGPPSPVNSVTGYPRAWRGNHLPVMYFRGTVDPSDLPVESKCSK